MIFYSRVSVPVFAFYCVLFFCFRFSRQIHARIYFMLIWRYCITNQSGWRRRGTRADADRTARRNIPLPRLLPRLHRGRRARRRTRGCAFETPCTRTTPAASPPARGRARRPPRRGAAPPRGCGTTRETLGPTSHRPTSRAARVTPRGEPARGRGVVDRTRDRSRPRVGQVRKTYAGLFGLFAREGRAVCPPARFASTRARVRSSTMDVCDGVESLASFRSMTTTLSLRPPTLSLGLSARRPASRALEKASRPHSPHHRR